jgi:hypothetical protein
MTEKIKNNISLVSIHIPKTAGTSFRTILKSEFGRRSVARFDIYPSGKIVLDDKTFKKDTLNKKIEVIHGHYTYESINKTLALSENVNFITWLRDPVERVISNYYFLNKIIAARLNESPEENLMNRMGKTIQEFVLLDENQNVMSKFLKGADLKSFQFVGLQNNFESELKRLQNTMNWKTIQNIEHNVTGNMSKQVNPEIIELIKTNNKQDIELYELALTLNSSINTSRK